MATDVTLLDSPDLYAGVLDCPPDDGEWGEENLVTRPIVAFPSTPVWMVRGGAAPSLVNRNDVTFHHAGGEYRRFGSGKSGTDACSSTRPSP